MFTNERRPRSCLVPLFHKRLYLRFSISIIVALNLLNTSSQAFEQLPAPSNTLLSTNALKVYVIYSFVEGLSAHSENEEIRLHLGMILAPADVQEYGGDYTGVEFWRVKMSDFQRTAFGSAIPRVGPMLQGKRSATRPCRANEYQGTNL